MLINNNKLQNMLSNKDNKVLEVLISSFKMNIVYI
jgi:hypothetical protein